MLSIVICKLKTSLSHPCWSIKHIINQGAKLLFVTQRNLQSYNLVINSTCRSTQYIINWTTKVLFVIHYNLQTCNFFQSNLLIYENIEYGSYTVNQRITVLFCYIPQLQIHGILQLNILIYEAHYKSKNQLKRYTHYHGFPRLTANISSTTSEYLIFVVETVQWKV